LAFSVLTAPAVKKIVDCLKKPSKHQNQPAMATEKITDMAVCLKGVARIAQVGLRKIGT
jgi:hypothetical protein